MAENLIERLRKRSRGLVAISHDPLQLSPTQDALLEEAADDIERLNAELAALRASLAQGQPVAWQWRSRINGGAWDAWENGSFDGPVPPIMEIEERPLYASPQAQQAVPEGWTQEQIEAAAKAAFEEWHNHQGGYRWEIQDVSTKKVWGRIVGAVTESLVAPASPAPVGLDKGTVEALARNDGGDNGGWTLRPALILEIREEAAEWASSVDMEAVEAIALVVERRVAAALHSLSPGRP